MTTENKQLPEDTFKQVVISTPLFAIDLVLVNNKKEVLLGERLNAPAKGYWFVPGGRVYKNESLEKAFERISKTELGKEMSLHKAKLLGLYEHFYNDSVFGNDVSTHYINATHVINVGKTLMDLPQEQHSRYQWLSTKALNNHSNVHPYSKVFLPELQQWMNEL